MTRFHGFYLESNFLNGDARSLTFVQLGILLRLFDILNQTPNKGKWGFLVDEKGTPLTDRNIRYLLGDGAALSHRTWSKTKEAFLSYEILKIIVIRGIDLLYSPPFIQMNPSSHMGQRRAAIKKTSEEKPVERFSKAFFMGYDPSDKRPGNELGNWGLICRKWIELSMDESVKIPQAPFPLSYNLESKQIAKIALLAQVKKIGIEQALHDMPIAFDYKKMRGERISTLSFFTARWMSKDWRDRQLPATRKKVDKKDQQREILYDEIKILVRKNKVGSLDDLIKYFPRADVAILTDISKGINYEH